MRTENIPEHHVLRVWQKEHGNKFDYYFEFIPDKKFECVDILVCEQYYMNKLVETYYDEQPDYCTLSKFCIPVSNDIKHKIIQYYENPSIKFLFD